MKTSVTKYVVQVSGGARGGKPFTWMRTKRETVDDLDKAYTFRYPNAAQRKADEWYDLWRRKAWVVKIVETREVVDGAL